MKREHLKDDGTGSRGVPVRYFAAQLGLSVKYVQDLCGKGQILGARKHDLTKQWWIYPPALLLCQPSGVKGHADSTTKRNSMSHVGVLA